MLCSCTQRVSSQQNTRAELQALRAGRMAHPLAFMSKYRDLSVPVAAEKPRIQTLSSERPPPPNPQGLGEGWSVLCRGYSLESGAPPLPLTVSQAPSLPGRPRARWSCWASGAPWTPWSPGPSWRHGERWPQGSTRPSGKRGHGGRIPLSAVQTQTHVA